MTAGRSVMLLEWASVRAKNVEGEIDKQTKKAKVTKDSNCPA